MAGLESTRQRLREQSSFRDGVIERAAEGICVCHAEEGSWQQLESYISNRSDALFSHGMCPHCAEKWMSEVEA